MEFYEVDWADSDIEEIQIAYDSAKITVLNDTLQEKLLIECSGLIGLTNLCIWDDTTIISAETKTIIEPQNEFTKKVYKAYDINYNYDDRSLNKGIIELNMELTNHICFSVYCLKIEVKKAEDASLSSDKSNN